MNNAHYLPDPPCLNRQSRSGTRSGRLTCVCSKSLANGTNLPDGSAAAFPLASACGWQAMLTFELSLPDDDGGKRTRYQTVTLAT